MEKFNNKCIYREKDGYCTKCQMNCPSVIRVSDDNATNMLCGGVSYCESKK